jgi:SAM-dependent methyltransferase
VTQVSSRLKGRVSALHPGATEHYRDAEAYELRYCGRSEDVDYYLRKCRGAPSILEYGAGAGRLTLPLAAGGAKILAVDTSAAMLNLLRVRLKTLAGEARQRVTVQQGDMRTFQTRRRFDVIVAGFHTLSHLYSRPDMEAFLTRAFTHLHPGGRLEFDLPFPRIDQPGYDPISQVCVLEMDTPHGPELLTQRWYHLQEIAMYLHYMGFTHVKLRSDFTASRVDPETSVFTVSARKPA